MDQANHTAFDESTDVMDHERLSLLVAQSREDEEQPYFDGPLTSLLMPSEDEAKAALEAEADDESSFAEVDDESTDEFDAEAITCVRPLPPEVAPRPPIETPTSTEPTSTEPRATLSAEKPAAPRRQTGTILVRVAALVILALTISFLGASTTSATQPAAPRTARR
jgi:hypothetical protein